jgi:hypothetical protein
VQKKYVPIVCTNMWGGGAHILCDARLLYVAVAGLLQANIVRVERDVWFHGLAPQCHDSQLRGASQAGAQETSTHPCACCSGGGSVGANRQPPGRGVRRPQAAGAGAASPPQAAYPRPEKEGEWVGRRPPPRGAALAHRARST